MKDKTTYTGVQEKMLADYSKHLALHQQAEAASAQRRVSIWEQLGSTVPNGSHKWHCPLVRNVQDAVFLWKSGAIDRRTLVHNLFPNLSDQDVKAFMEREVEEAILGGETTK